VEQSVSVTALARIIDSPRVQLRGQGEAGLPTLLHLPGLHGDWTLLGPFRKQLAGQARLIETTYPRQCEWKLSDYATALEESLRESGVRRCWLLGESFSSQIAWELLARASNTRAESACEFAGLILVGGFIKHPWPWGVWLAQRASGGVPDWVLRRACGTYGWLARRRCGAEGCGEVAEFVARRLAPDDRIAITARYHLIADNDPRPCARSTRLPVYHLSGIFDPLVPWWQVRPWLRRHCPGFRESRMLFAGHNVLLAAPAASARQILEWIKDSERGLQPALPSAVAR
jgi:pimeloyl-ACP methyl ester carboxylesterase